MKTFRLFTFALSFMICFSCVRAEQKEMKASEILSLVKKEKSVHVVDKIIIGEVDFTEGCEPFILSVNMLQCDIMSNIFFENCVFMDKVTSNGKHGKTPVQSRFMRNLLFNGCDFRGEVDFSDATVFGMVSFGRTVFREKANFNNIAVWSKDSYFSEMKAEKTFSMVYSYFAGNLNFLDAAFDGNASFQEITVTGKLSFKNSVFKDRAGFDMMTVSGNASFNYARFEKTANFSWARFMGAAEFVNANFETQPRFEKTLFLNKANFEGIDPDRLIIEDGRWIDYL